MLRIAFPVILPPKMILTNFHKKNCDVLKVRYSILVYDVIKNSENFFIGKHWQVTYQQTQMTVIC